MFSPTTMALPKIKTLGFMLWGISSLLVLVSCQSHPNLGKECKNDGNQKNSKTNCRENLELNDNKPRFSRQFTVDPHAGHKTIERIAIIIPEKRPVKKEREDVRGGSGGSTRAADGRARGTSKEETITTAEATTGKKSEGIKSEGIKSTVKKQKPERSVSFSIKNPDHKFRYYAHSVISPNLHAPRSIRYEEKPGNPRLRTGSVQFDALFALAHKEMRASQLSRTSDSDYQNGKSQRCICFGDKSSDHFLSLPDLALSGYLGLSTLNSERMANSLLFQLSAYRDGLAPSKAVPGAGRGLQIIQRSGKSGSWPIYSDRVMWALAAKKTLNTLADGLQEKFSKRAYHALKNTIEIDRVSIFDGADGLYVGAHSTYTADANADSMVSTTTQSATKNLIVNLSYYHALKFAADLAQTQNDVVSSVKYADWAVDLKHAVNQKFWMAAAGLYQSQYTSIVLSSSDDVVGENSFEQDRSLFSIDSDPQFEWWAQALAVSLGVAGDDERNIVMAHHPKFYDMTSPFQAALSLRAAAKTKRVGIADIAYRRLIDNVSTQLSNPKVFETVGRAAQEYSNKGNLLSVSAYSSMVVDTLFGVKVSKRGLRFEPFITTALRTTQFGGQRSISLVDIRLQQKNISIKIIFPFRKQKNNIADTYYSIHAVEVNGESVSGEVAWSRLNATNDVVIKLGKRVKKGGERGGVREAGNGKLETGDGEWEAGDGRRGKEKGTGKDREAKENVSVSTVLSRDGHRLENELSRVMGKGIEIGMSDARVHLQSSGNRIKRKGALGYLSNWGAPADRLRIENITIENAGLYAIQLQYRNPTADASGIANAVKWMTVYDHNGNEYGAKIIGMPLTPQVRGEKNWQYSVPVTLHLNPGTYEIRVEDFLNMSYLKANMAYNGKGGLRGFSNRADIKTIRITSINVFR